MLWNEIYIFFIKYVFGGYLSTSQGVQHYDALFGTDLTNAREYYTYNVSFQFLGRDMPLGNYFSFIATIIFMVVIIILCCLLIKKIYNICAHIIG